MVVLVAQPLDNRLLEQLQPSGSYPPPLPVAVGSFSSHVTFSSPARADPRAVSGVAFASVFGTATPAGPVASGVNFGSSFQAQGNDLASGRYRR